MSGEIEKVLQRAADDPAFLELLIEDRAAALEAFDASDAVRDVLSSAGEEQLRAMVAGVSKTKRSRLGCLAAFGVAATAAAAFTFTVGITATAGVSPERHAEFRAMSVLKNLSIAQQMYREEYGSYGELDDLVDAEVLLREFVEEHIRTDTSLYAYEVTVDGDRFRVVARHRRLPDARKAFVVESDGRIRELDEDGG